MQSILDAINEWIKGILIGAINGNLSTMFGDVNEKVGTIANEVGKTPQGWNEGIFSMIQSLSENVIVPIAGLVITYVLCYELISMVIGKNNMHDVDTFMFFKWFFKAFVAVFLVTHTFDITMAVFDMAQHIVSGAAGVIGGDTAIDVSEALASMQEGLNDMEIPELLLLMLETSLVSLCMKIMSVLITVILYGRMIEIYAYCSVSPIPFATMTNREWGADRHQLPKGAVRAWFSRLSDYDMRRHLRCPCKRHDNRRQLTQRDIFPCSLYGNPLFFPVQIRRTCKTDFFRTLSGHIRRKEVFNGVCTRTERLIQSQDKGCVQPYQTADCLSWGGSPCGIAAFLSAQRQRGDDGCSVRDDTCHVTLLPLCHV